ncbi:MAG: hypothetical protein Q8S73_44030 [Deltaproteobacteria bacterium]|nr:hypothetical protein [Myxococcales bacterium]MDP3221134.1 hypothetical protein [Deltaproteobacteria bacterium]
MSDHPSIDALRAHLDAPDPALGAHLDACGDCTRRAARLSAGLAALDEARRLTPVPPAWDRMDDVLTREARSVSQDIRSGRLRPAARVPSWVATGLAMAAGVGLLLGGRALLKSQETPTVAPIVATRPTPTVAPAPALTPYEGVVLLAAGGARYREPGVEAGALLARTTGLREGASVETPDAARAVFTVRSGWTADLRPGSSMKLSQLRTEQTAVTLDRGELALTPGAGQTLPARVLHDGWSVEAHGPLLARVESSVLRVVVLAGRTDIRRGEAEALTVTGPLVIDLPLDGSAPTPSTLTAADQAALDLDALSALGTSYEIPTIDPSATLTLLQHGALPSALESIRLAGPGTIQARVGRTEMRLELGAGVTPRWATFRSTVAPTVALNRVNAVARAAPPAAETGDTMPPDRAMLAVTNSARRIFGRCIDTCFDRLRCQQPITGRVDVEMSAAGRASIVSTHPSMAPVRACFEEQAPFVHGPQWQNSYRFAVPFDRR